MRLLIIFHCLAAGLLAQQFTCGIPVTRGDVTVNAAAFRVTVKFSSVDAPVSAIVERTGTLSLVEFPVEDIGTAVITLLKVEKLVADAALDYTAP